MSVENKVITLCYKMNTIYLDLYFSIYIYIYKCSALWSGWEGTITRFLPVYNSSVVKVDMASGRSIIKAAP